MTNNADSTSNSPTGQPARGEFPEITHIKKRKFLSAFSIAGTVTGAAKAAGVSRRSHSTWLREDPSYAKAFATAQDMACDRLEQEAIRRAVSGVERKKFHKGEPIIDPSTGEQYVEREYSDTMLIFLLKGLRPEKYGDRAVWDRIAAVEKILNEQHAEGRHARIN